jgi:hypothetical protein
MASNRKGSLRKPGGRGISRLAPCPEKLAEILDLIENRKFNNRPKDTPDVLRNIWERIAVAKEKLREFGDGVTSEVTIKVSIDGAGKVNTRPDGEFVDWLAAFCGVTADNVKVCEHEGCGKPFWAGRKDRRGCCPRHCRAINTRRWRERYLERYKHARYGAAQRREKGRKRV